MSNQDIEGRIPPDPAPGAATPPGAAPSLEQELAKEREAKALIRDRLRHTEALAAESHALRAAMAQELEKVTKDRDRLRNEAATASATAAAAPAPSAPAAGPAARSAGTMPGPVEPSMAPVPPPRPAPAAATGAATGERPFVPPRRRGPWRALAMLGGLAAGVAGIAWLTGTMPTGAEMAAAPASAAALPAPAEASAAVASARIAPHAASTTLAAATPSPATVPPPSGAVPLPPRTPEAELAAAPTAAGPVAETAATPSPAPATANAAAPAGMAARLRKALDGEGIAAPVEVDAGTGHVVVSDAKPDPAVRDRTDMLIRAVYAGASLPEPQIEHRWLVPKRGDAPTVATTTPEAPAPNKAPPQAQPQAQTAGLSPAAAYLARHPVTAAPPSTTAATPHVADHARKAADLTVADAEELRPVLPSGHLTASCMDNLTGKSTARRSAMTVCMKHSCCSSAANLNSEECRAYTKAYPFACGG